MTPREIVRDISKNRNMGRYLVPHSKRNRPFVDRDLIQEDYGIGRKTAAKVKRRIERRQSRRSP